ncbi:hypothetical protein [Aquimarina sp. 2201CG5-10]|uniref:hypothetical protein n=1 Tax=Aquimarina callyspongiae TaxID=3098150 RepID=UPI002AB46821|nr:hypothetical protein [Aquimarina sp. 2201CG5-10]MDY8137244.1 hypothetical protein [Aquimarina sp. 2201CG5-10]
MKKNNLHTNKSGFKVPDNYFEDFEKNILASLPTQNESHLSDNKNTGFKVPDDYFAKFDDNLSKKIDAEKSSGKVISIFSKRNILYFSSIAAMIAIILTVYTSKDKEFDFNKIDVADIQSYFDEGNVELSDNEIASLLDEDISFAETFNDQSIDEEELIEYLSNEEIDEDIIYIE